MIRSIIIFFCIFFLINCKNQNKIQTNVAALDSVKLTRLISENKSNILVINVWATWCVPCVEEMPALVKLTDSYETKNVKIIGISIDYPDEIQTKILPFIKKNNINFPVYVNDFKTDEAFINFLNKKWSGAIPATFIYGKDGHQKEFFIGKHSFDNFKAVVEKYL